MITLSRSFVCLSILLIVFFGAVTPTVATEIPTAEKQTANKLAADIQQTVSSAIHFYTEKCSKQGGYVWRYSRDLKLSEGEAETPGQTIWVQPPGTPLVGEAFLQAYRTFGQPAYLQAARQTGAALLAGQMQSGGWYYSITFDPVARSQWGYRDNTRFHLRLDRKNKMNTTTLDDDTTPSAVRFLMRLDQATNFQDQQLHEAIEFALQALMLAQHPVGGWSQNWDRHPEQPAWPRYPVQSAGYPLEWSREWLNDWTGKYYLNDNVAGNMIDTFLLAWEIYGEDRYRATALRAGDFLLRAQMPQPQPAWAQQYDENMYPVWDRKFEPPAIASDETQEAIAALLQLYEKTGEERFLAPLPAALDYLQASLLEDGQLARFYELQTNRPLYFQVVNNKYELTYTADDLPTHYAFKIPAKIDKLSRRYQELLASRTPVKPATPGLKTVNDIIDAIDERGAWVVPGNMKGYHKASPEGVIESETFFDHITLLCRYYEKHFTE